MSEVLDFKLSGEGDHLYLRMHKRNTNTDWLARELASKANLEPVDIGYAGRKDRFAVTSQWFSLHLPGKREIALSQLQTGDYHVIEQGRHHQKLRRGQLAYNRFKLQLTHFNGSYEHFQERVKRIATEGFPNYFGPQRFGHEFSNIDKARLMLADKLRVRDRNKRSLYLSAARSYLFNLVLAERITQGKWTKPLTGDRFWDHNDKRLSDSLPLSDQLFDLLASGDLSITGPMPGDGQNTVTDDALLFESSVLSEYAQLNMGIANSRVKWQRRPLRTIPGDLSSNKNNQGVEIEFTLNPGAYATSLLRELLFTDRKSQ